MRDVGLVAGEREQQRQALGAVAVVVDDEHAQATRRRRRGRRAAGRRVAGACASGKVTTNSLPSPRPALFATTLPPCISTRRLTSVRPMPRPPCARSSELSICDEHLEDAADAVGGDADAVVAHADDGVLAVDARIDHDPAAVGRELARVADQVAEHLRQPRAVGLQPDRALRQAHLEDVAGALGRRPARLDRVLEHRAEVGDARRAASACRG